MSFCIRTAPAARREASDIMWKGQEISGIAKTGEVVKMALSVKGLLMEWCP